LIEKYSLDWRKVDTKKSICIGLAVSGSKELIWKGPHSRVSNGKCTQWNQNVQNICCSWNTRCFTLGSKSGVYEIHFVEKIYTLLLITSILFSFSKVMLKECVDVDPKGGNNSGILSHSRSFECLQMSSPTLMKKHSSYERTKIIIVVFMKFKF